MSLSAVIVDDEQLARDELAYLLKDFGDVNVVAQGKNGLEAVNLRVAEQYVTQFGNLAKTNNTLILPSNVADIASIIGTAMSAVRSTGAGRAPGTAPAAAPRPGAT